MIPAQRQPGHDRLVLADGHVHAGQTITIVQPVGTTGYLVRIGDDPTRITPQYVPDSMIVRQEDQR
jgi:hypothetical protein